MKRVIKFIICIIEKIKNIGKCSIHITAIVIGKCLFEGKNVIGKNTRLRDCQVGYGSYIGSNGYFTNTKIGRFCSIASDVKVVEGRHPLNNVVSTHPAFYSKGRKFFKYVCENKFDETEMTPLGFYVEIGNDVWIGTGVMIKAGVKINDGAVIGMGAVITKDVPAYAIVDGVPAKEIRYRFNDSEIERLIGLKIWDKPISYYEENAERFMNANKFIKEEYYSGRM